MTEQEIKLMREHGMTGNCNYCSRPVRPEKKYCDPFCTYSQIAKNEAGTESGNDARN